MFLLLLNAAHTEALGPGIYLEELCDIGSIVRIGVLFYDDDGTVITIVLVAVLRFG